MGRNKIEIKKIIDKQKKHVTFTKRRDGLFKMLKDTASKFNVEIASIVFSECGRVYSFGSHHLDATIDKFIRDSGSTVSTVHCQELEKCDDYEETQTLIEEAKRFLSKNDNELIRVDELIKYRSDLQILKDKLVKKRESNCSSQKTYKDDDSSSSRITSCDNEFCDSHCQESVCGVVVPAEPVGLQLTQTRSAIDTTETFESYYKALENIDLPEEPTGQEMVQIQKETDLSEMVESYSEDLVYDVMFMRDEMVQTGKGCSLEELCGDDASLSTNVGFSPSENAAMSDFGEVSNSYWTDLVREGLFDRELSAPNSFVKIGDSDWGDVFGSSCNVQHLQSVLDEHNLAPNLFS